MLCLVSVFFEFFQRDVKWLVKNGVNDYLFLFEAGIWLKSNDKCLWTNTEIVDNACR